MLTVNGQQPALRSLGEEGSDHIRAIRARLGGASGEARVISGE